MKVDSEACSEQCYLRERERGVPEVELFKCQGGGRRNNRYGRAI